MTTARQELMLFGGWAKVRTMYPIENGASKISDTVSVSTSKKTFQLKIYLYRRQPFEYQGRNVREENYGDWEVRAMTESEHQDWTIENIKVLLIDNLKKTGMVRYIELWGQNEVIDTDRFLRGVAGTEAFKRSIAGMMGGLNSSKKVEQISSNEWRVCEFPNLYRNVNRLQKAGIENAQETAWKIHETN